MDKALTGTKQLKFEARHTQTESPGNLLNSYYNYYPQEDFAKAR